MTVEQILIVAFGTPTLMLLTGIFYRLGVLKASYAGMNKVVEKIEQEIDAIWSSINRIKERIK